MRAAGGVAGHHGNAGRRRCRLRSGGLLARGESSVPRPSLRRYTGEPGPGLAVVARLRAAAVGWGHPQAALAWAAAKATRGRRARSGIRPAAAGPAGVGGPEPTSWAFWRRH